MKKGVVAGEFTEQLKYLDSPLVFGVAQTAMDYASLARTPAPMQFVILTFERALGPWLDELMALPQFSGDIYLGNEPNTSWVGSPTPEAYAAYCRESIKYLNHKYPGLPSLRIFLSCSTQGQLPGNWHHPTENLIGYVWGEIPPRLQELVTGFHFHAYPEWTYVEQEKVFNPYYIARYVRGMRAWMESVGIPDKKLVLSEIGFSDRYAPDDQRIVDYIRELLLHPYLNRTLETIFWYPATVLEGDGGTNKYLPLLSPHGIRNARGEMWYGTRYPEARHRAQP